MKGSSSDSLKPFVSLAIPEPVKTLEDLRDMLSQFKYMSSTDAFLTKGLFPIHKEDEHSIEWETALADPHAAQADKEQDSPNRKGRETASKSIMIVSRRSNRGSPPEASLPKLPKMGSPSLDTKPPPIEKPDLVKAERSEITVNAKTLDKEQLDELVRPIYIKTSKFHAETFLV